MPVDFGGQRASPFAGTRLDYIAKQRSQLSDLTRGQSMIFRSMLPTRQCENPHESRFGQGYFRFVRIYRELCAVSITSYEYTQLCTYPQQ